MKNFKSAICILLAMLFITACNDRTPEEYQRMRGQAHEREMARIQMGQTYAYQPHHYSYADTMAVALTAGYVASVFTPSYAPVMRGGLYYDMHGGSISRAVYETRIVTVKENKAKHKKSEKSKLANWKKDPKNSKKFKSSKKKADTKYKAADKKKFKSGSKTAATKKWGGSDKSSTSWNNSSKSKPKKTVSRATTPRKHVKRAPKPRKVAKRSATRSSTKKRR